MSGFRCRRSNEHIIQAPFYADRCVFSSPHLNHSKYNFSQKNVPKVRFFFRVFFTTQDKRNILWASTFAFIAKTTTTTITPNNKQNSSEMCENFVWSIKTNKRQPRSQGFSPPRRGWPLLGREKPWERGWIKGTIYVAYYDNRIMPPISARSKYVQPFANVIKFLGLPCSCFSPLGKLFWTITLSIKCKIFRSHCN